MEVSVVFHKVAIALGLGLLVGLQRERAAAPLGGIRTFPLITLCGTFCALLAQSFGGWVIAAGLLAISSVLVIGYLSQAGQPEPDPGVTTDVAALLMYALGAYLVVGHTAVAIAMGGGTAVLLHFKGPLHRLVARLGDEDAKLIMQFVLIALVILPVLPNRTLGPYDVFNPFKAWLLVVLVVGMSLSGYVAYVLLGTRVGSWLAGLLGGLISSTATTVGFSRQAAVTGAPVGLSAFVIVLASTVSLARVIGLVAVVASPSLRMLAPPLSAMLGLMVVASGVAALAARRTAIHMPTPSNPAQLQSAIVFAAMFCLVSLAAAAGREHFGERGLYAVAVFSGLTDMDAITLSTAGLVAQGRIDPGMGWRAILLAAMSNTVFKTATVAALGPRRLFVRVGGAFAAILAGGSGILLFWP